jgi:hypothetical protein
MNLDFHALVVDEIHRPSVRCDQPRPLEIEPRHVGSHVDPSPVGLCPLLSLLGHSLGEFGVSADTSNVTVEVGKGVMKVAVVDVDGHVVDPGLDTVAPPFGVNARLEEQRTAHEKSLSTGRPLRRSDKA